MREYGHDPAAIIRDIGASCIEKRSDRHFVYPNLSERLGVLRINWVAYEDLLEAELGTDVDLTHAQSHVAALKERIGRATRELTAQDM